MAVQIAADLSWTPGTGQGLTLAGAAAGGGPAEAQKWRVCVGFSWATEGARALAAGVRSARSWAVGKEIPPLFNCETCYSKAARVVDAPKKRKKKGKWSSFPRSARPAPPARPRAPRPAPAGKIKKSEQSVAEIRRQG